VSTALFMQPSAMGDTACTQIFNSVKIVKYQ